MLVKTSCGHQYPKPWSEGFLRFAPFFFCEVCGNSETVPPDFQGGDFVETVDAAEMARQMGWPPAPPSMDAAADHVVEVTGVTIHERAENDD